jgi:hypothetical protein
MKNEDKAAFANALYNAAHQLDQVVVRTDLNLPYDISSALIGVACDIRQGALALKAAPGAADVYLDGAVRTLTSAVDGHEAAAFTEVVRALETVARTLAAMAEAAEEADPPANGR